MSPVADFLVLLPTRTASQNFEKQLEIMVFFTVLPSFWAPFGSILALGGSKIGTFGLFLALGGSTMGFRGS